MTDAAAVRAKYCAIWPERELERRSLDLARRSLFGQSSAHAVILARARAFRTFLRPGWDSANRTIFFKAIEALESAVISRGFGRRRVSAATLLRDAKAYYDFLGESE
jgi:hypothetical protein